MVAMEIQSDDPGRSHVVALLQDHQTIAREHGDPDTVHAFDRDELSADNVHFFSARGESELLGIGALLHLASWHYEIKSMHTSNLARRREWRRRWSITLSRLHENSERVAAFVSDLIDCGSPSRARNVRTLLVQIMDQAVQFGLAADNVARRVKTPKVPQVKRRTITPA